MSPIDIFKNKRNTEQTKGSLKLFVPNKKSKVAFTLAEVLITLGIIGVVAAMTLPTLIQHHQKKQTVTQLKKAYSELSQAINMAQVDYGTPEDWDFADFETSIERTTYFGDNYLFPHLKVIRKCIPSSNECWADDIKTISNNIADSYIQNNSYNPHVSFVTASGYSVFYWIHGSGNGGWFYVDINGHQKAPNKLGRDIFVFLLSNGTTDAGGVESKKGLQVYGAHLRDNLSREALLNPSVDSGMYFLDYACDRSSTKSYAGGYCGGLIVLDGWEIKDDYPW